MLRRRFRRARTRRRERRDARRRGHVHEAVRGSRPHAGRRPARRVASRRQPRASVRVRAVRARMTAPVATLRRTGVASELQRARERSLALLAPIPDADQRRQVSDLMSPLCWDLAHIAHYEELWLLRALSDAAPTNAAYDDLYDAFKHPR